MKRSDIFLILLFGLQIFFYNYALTNLKFFFVSLKFSTSFLNHILSVLYTLIFIVIFVNLVRLYQAYKAGDKSDAEYKVGQVIYGTIAIVVLNFLLVSLASRLP